MPFATSLIVIGAAIFVGKAVYDYFHDDGSSSQPQAPQDRPQARPAYTKPTPQAKVQETRFPGAYHGSQGTYQYEQQRRTSTGAAKPFVSGASPAVAQQARPPPGANVRTITQGYAKPNYSSVVSSNASSGSRYSPYPAAERSTTSNYQVNYPRGSDVFVDVSNRDAYTRVERDRDGSDLSHDGWLGSGTSTYDQYYAEVLRQAERLVHKPHVTSPRTTQSKRRIKQKRNNKQITPRKSKDELEKLIDLEVAILGPRFPIRDKDRVGFINRNAARELRSRCDAAGILKERAFKERRCEDGTQLNFIRRELFAESKRLDALAATEIYAHYNRPRFDSEGNEIASRRCDVHGLYVAEAQDFVKRFLDACVEKVLRDVKIVTGKGIHSEGGEAKLRPAILGFLKCRSDIEEPRIDESNTGCVLVRLKLTQSETSMD